ncbi:galactose mutarotase-like domain-containing protein [Kockovaella imperatae]|uniref:Galactose mutarotase-like domain-containing protein n=1 Tax=Kockovaella imperatae TaxID=4999 RepID=A0A1Y1ULW7_9TREE|nr:galactose mutarotase-like domain-containing protein [Kockovaella imperatae]ORX39048.1 galactose mutarotase-like domain-containing protein [Kockovaella imperatae]
MKFTNLVSFAALSASTLFPSVAQAWNQGSVDGTDPFQPYTIYAYGINATFIGYGSRLTSLFVHDKNNIPREVVVGYDDPHQYLIDTETNRTFFGAIVGPYANRIKNGTFNIDGETFHVPENEHDGEDTLHGGFDGYDTRNWTMTQYNTSSITFTLYDSSGTGGFPGTKISHVTFSLSDATANSRGKLTGRMVTVALDQPTPVMLASHIYWNLGAFQSTTILNDTLWMPNANRIISIDGIEVPTGGLQSVKYPFQSPSVPLNFTYPKQVYEGVLYSQQCGTGCTGIDNAFILDRPPYDGPESTSDVQLQWQSPDTGITLKLRTNQQSLQIYTCNGQNGSIRSHASQGNPKIEKYGCLVVETQQWIDGINQPEWGQLDRQIFGAMTGPAVNWLEYEFTTEEWDY